MTTYNELTSHGRWLIDQRFSQELREYKKSSIWWRKLDSDCTQNMLQHFKKFVQFRRKVLDGSCLAEAMQEWVGTSEPIDSWQFAAKRNVPQLVFCDAINQACRELAAFESV